MENVSELSLKYLANAVRRRWGIALLVAAPLFAAGVVYIFSLTPAYTSTAVVLLAPAAEELTDASSGRAGAMTDPFFIRSETTIIGSDGLSRAVVEKLKLWDDPEFQPQPGVLDRLGWRTQKNENGVLSKQESLEDSAVRYYQDNLSVSNDGRSKTVAISYTAADPRLAAAVANTHAEVYLLEQSTRRVGSQQQAIDWLAHEVDARAAEVQDADAQVQRYQLTHGIVKANDSTLVEQRLSQLSTQLVEARRQFSTQNAMLSEIRHIRAGGDAGNAAALLGDTPFKNLLSDRVEKEASISSLEKRLAPNHPTLVKARQELGSINNVLNNQLQRAENDALSALNSSQRQVDDLSRAVSEATASKVDQDRVGAAMPALMAQAQVKRTVFETVLNRYQTLLAERGFSAPAASVVSRAMPSALPSFPRKSLLLAIAAMVAGFLGCVAAVAAQLGRPASVGLAPMADAVGIRPLSAVPKFRTTPRIDGTISMRDPRLFVESIRFLRDAVLERERNRHTTTCLVTSALPRQGKSVVAMSLARALARTRRKTLFIELDLRQPTASTLARCKYPTSGTAAVLEGRATVRDVVVRDEVTGLDMLLAEADAKGALDRLTTTVLRSLLASVRNEYDAIVIDSPPVGIVSDALTIATVVDQTLVVAREGACSIKELGHAIRLLKDRSATIAGLVLTCVDPNGMSSVDKRTLRRYVTGVASPRVEPTPGRSIAVR